MIARYAVSTLAFVCLAVACFAQAQSADNGLEDLNKLLDSALSGDGQSNKTPVPPQAEIPSKAQAQQFSSPVGRKIAADECFYRGSDLLRAGKYDSAFLELSKAIEIESRDDRYYRRRSDALLKMGKVDQAIADCNAAVEINRYDNDNYECRGDAFLKKGDVDGAISDYSKAIELNPNMWTAYGSRSFAWKKKGDINKAKADAAKALKINASAVVPKF